MRAVVRTHRVDRSHLRHRADDYANAVGDCRPSPPPGHEERLRALEERICREMGQPEHRERQRSTCPSGYDRLRRGQQTERRRQVVRLLAAAPGEVTSPEIGAAMGGLTANVLRRLLQHAWFHRRRRVMHGRPKGGGHLPSVITLTPEGRAEAQRLAREGGCPC